MKASVLNDLPYLAPEILLAIGGLVVLLLGAIRPPSDRRLLGTVTIGWLALAAVASVAASRVAPSQPLFFGMLTVDGVTTLGRLVAIAAIGLVALISVGYRRLPDQRAGEWMALLLFAAVGVMLVAGAMDLALVYIAVELVSVASYILVGMLREEATSSEGSLKYFLYGALSTGLLLYGLSLLYGALGSLHLTALGSAFLPGVTRLPLVSIGVALIVAGLGFKVAMVPFHMWAPDAYQGAPVPVAAFLSVASKAAGLLALVRLFQIGLGSGMWPDLFAWLAVLTMTLGNVVALRQTNIKRLMAYSSVAQAGYLLIGLVCFGPLGMTAIIVYLAAYLAMNLGAFGCITALGDLIGSDQIDDYRGVAQRAPVLAALLTLFLLSLAGIPPMAGFIGKWLLFSAAIEAGRVGLAVAAVINSVVSVAYYVNIVRPMYFEPSAAPAAPAPVALRAAVSVAFAAMMLIGLWPAPLMALAQRVMP